jgi:glycerophosphoryl diester phosphodiesterase
MTINRFLLFSILLLLLSCKRFLDASIPDTHWAVFDAPAAKPLPPSVNKNLEGVYKISGQDDDFGDFAALKWTYTVAGKDTTYTLSIFCEEDVRYFICQAKRMGDSILLNGYWRNVENTKTGKGQLFILPHEGAKELLDGGKPSKILVRGNVGSGDGEANREFGLSYLRPLYNRKPLEIIAHRGGGRNSDLLPASENSIELIKRASSYGATGIEIDVKMTKDGVAVLYHDANVNDRLTNQIGVHPPIAKYTYAELSAKVRLKDGQRIPTLRQALETVLYNTPLNFVWLDSKNPDCLPVSRQLQAEFMKAAAAMGRQLEITIGIPDDDVLKKFQQLPDHKSLPSVCELDTAKALSVNSKIWAQGWTKGFQEASVAAMHAKGKRAFVWTLDVPKLISYCLNEGSFDGIVTNRPSIAAYYYYSKQ